eukprot:TRINITY_DN1281_c0_g1_i2.p1 TRINITY_DN1281_c0_g1~~TRINITY_DN1281_c0_g1_i2.p1  ORF type:complete len:173 (+),score=34.45 TRINITY_DN1281_c0_g1_i2:66-584(+)
MCIRDRYQRRVHGELILSQEKPKFMEEEQNYKIILVGDSNVGKTSFLQRLIKNVPPQQYEPTIGVQYQTKRMELQNYKGAVKTQIWDTAGSEKYKAITTAHYRKSQGVLLFFDLTNERSFKNMTSWLHDIEENTEEGIVIMVIGAKKDLVNQDESRRQIPQDVIQDLSLIHI